MTKKIAVVTGVNGSLGEAMAQALHEQGRQLVGTYLPSLTEAANSFVQDMQEKGITVTMYPLDITDYDAACAFAEQVESELGPIDILINNAGITNDAPLKRMEPEQWHSVIDTNLSSMYNLCQPIFTRMCERGWGRVVNISSLNGEKGQFGQANYAAAKAGIYGFTKSLAQEGARKGVTVNSVSPGYMNTPMVRKVPEKILESIVASVPVGRLGEPYEIGRAVAFLTHDDSGYITGTNLSVNGGQYM